MDIHRLSSRLRGNWPEVARLARAWLPSRGNVVFTLLVAAVLLGVGKVGAVPAKDLSGSSTSQNTIVYQGRLTDAGGVPLSGTYVMAFRLYDAATAGTKLWEENRTGGDSVVVTRGLFTVHLGSVTALPSAVIISHSDLWLGITVGTDAEMSPRVQLGSAPYAFQATYATSAGNADAVDGQDASVLVPPGTVVAYGGATPPAGWLLCNGAAVSRTQYAALFAAIGIAHGSGNGTTTFNVPDYRGRFLRGVDGGTGRDPDRAGRTAMNPGGQTGDNVGSVQTDQFRSHSHTYTWRAGTHTRYGDPTGEQFWYDYGTNSTDPAGGNETRPVNAAVNWIIKY
jgi:microcystin-dependent protein